MGASQNLVQTSDPSIGGADLDCLPEVPAGRDWKWLAIAVLAGVTVLGFIGRLVLSWYSLGSDDWLLWWGFSGLVGLHGPFNAYAIDSNLNHPPLPLIWSLLALGVAALAHVHFSFIFRLAPIAADAGTCLLLYRIWTSRGGDRRWGWLAAAAFAWNLDAIMDGAYDCNTDNICAFFTLLAAYQFADRRNFYLGGLALAGAINVKIVPVVLIPAFFSLCRDWTDAGRFIKGMAIGAIPFLIVLYVTPVAFIRNVLFYNSMVGEWGLMIFPQYGQYIPLINQPSATVLNWFHAYGKYPMLLIAAGLGVLAWRLRRWDAYQLGALGWCVFLIFTPGWGLQYTVYVVPLMMAVSLGRGTLYGLVAGLYLLAAYAGGWHPGWQDMVPRRDSVAAIVGPMAFNARAWHGTLPLQSVYDGAYHVNPLPVPLAFLAWGILVGFFCLTLWRGIVRRA